MLASIRSLSLVLLALFASLFVLQWAKGCFIPPDARADLQLRAVTAGELDGARRVPRYWVLRW
jgi:hypothetical protein